jgi:hypothetical protein
MITLDDIEDMTTLSRAEIDAIAEHEYSSVFDAALMGEYLMHVHHGPQKVHRMICDDIRAALKVDNLPHARELFAVLRGFLHDHPEAARGARD